MAPAPVEPAQHLACASSRLWSVMAMICCRISPVSGAGGGPGSGRRGAGGDGAGRCGRGGESMNRGAQLALRGSLRARSAHKGAAANHLHPRAARAHPQAPPLVTASSQPPPAKRPRTAHGHAPPSPSANCRRPGRRAPPTDTPLTAPFNGPGLGWVAEATALRTYTPLFPPSHISPPPSPAQNKDSCLETLILLRAPHVSSEPQHLLREVLHFLRDPRTSSENLPISSAPCTPHQSSHSF